MHNNIYKHWIAVPLWQQKVHSSHSNQLYKSPSQNDMSDGMSEDVGLQEQDRYF